MEYSAKQILKIRNLDELELVQERDGSVELWGYGTYEQTSVLAGQFRKVFIDSWESMDEARADLTSEDLEIIAADGDGPRAATAEVPHTAPAWFDPADAGEAWGENDY